MLSLKAMVKVGSVKMVMSGIVLLVEEKNSQEHLNTSGILLYIALFASTLPY